jgi:GAF domain-containing protein
VGGLVIGALDVQSEEASAFDEDDVRVLQTMADQLAVAIQNVRLLHEMQQTVRELEAAHGRYTREAWRAFVRGGKRPYGYRYRRLGVEPVAEQYPEAREALQQGRPVVTTLQPESHAGPLAAEDSGRNAISSLAVPIKLRGQAVGTLNLRFEDETVPPETVLLVEEVADRLALVLENARLMQEAQNLVLREQQINLVSAQVRSSISMETILQNTVRELGKALGASRTFIQLGTEPGSLPPSDGAATVGDQERDKTRL